MKVMYQTGSYRAPIERREWLRETEHFVFVSRGNGCERREGKRTDYGCWFETFQDAKSHLISEKERLIDSLQRELGQAQKELVEIQELSDSP